MIKQRKQLGSQAAKQPGIGKACHCEEQTKSATSQSQNVQNSTIMRLLRHSVKKQTAFTNTVPRNDGHVNHLLTYLPTNLLTPGRRKAAFTLAEVLITLTIIGVVAAMTMPSLIAKHQEKETVTKLKKVYSTLSQAYQFAENENGTPDNWTTGIAPRGRGVVTMNILAKNMKVLKNCENGTGCFPDVTYMSPNGEEYWNINTDGFSGKVQLADGTLIAYSILSAANYGEGKHLSSVCGIFDVDINGANKPNLLGRDTFEFYLTKYGIIPAGMEGENDDGSPFSSCLTTGIGCAAWVIFNENTDYLKCPDKLGWDKASSCK